MVVAIYGGSFNPPHVGHALVAAWLLWTRQADAVWLLPVFRHAFEKRHNKALVPWADRLAWCEAFAQDVDPRVRVEAIEAERMYLAGGGGVSVNPPHEQDKYPVKI